MVLFYTPTKKAVSSSTFKLQIKALDAFGQGIAYHNGKTIFVRNALPSEEVEVKLTEDKKQYAKARVIKYCSTSSMRAEPQCQHYGRCGGCEMQHIAPVMQHTIKSQALINLLHKETDYLLTEQAVSVVASNPYHYRRRARLAIMLVNNQLQIGFRKKESNQIVDIKMCPVLVEELAHLLLPLKSCLQQLKNKKALGHAELIHTESGTILVLRHIHPLNDADRAQLIAFAKQYHLSLYLHGESCEHVYGSTNHYYDIEQWQLVFSPLDFIQVNATINEKMIQQAISWLDLQPTDAVLDLFCGMGNFSLPIAARCRKVIGVEGVPALVERAKQNLVLNAIKTTGTVDFFVGNLDNIDHQPIWFPSDINKVLLDPARAGAYQVMDKIIEHRPSHVVYISCNPATLVRDSKKLLQAGYQIVKSSILDMFPQTKHIESMLLFINIGTH